MALSEEEKQERKNARQREYAKRTGYAAQKAYQQRTGYEANYKSNKKNTKMFGLRLSYSADGDMIDYLDGLENKNDYIRGLIRADMAAIHREHRTRVIPLFGNSFAAGPGEQDFPWL